jgi:hypothetical protein
MNKTVMFVTFAILAGLGIIGTAVLVAFRPDATATFTNLLITVLGLVSVAGATFYGFGKQGDKLDEIKAQTNGQLHSKEREIERLRQRLADNGITAEDSEDAP